MIPILTPSLICNSYLPVNTGQHRPYPGDHCDEAVHQEDPGLVDPRAVRGQDHDAGDHHGQPGEEEGAPSSSLPFGNRGTSQLLQTLGIAATHSSEIFRICSQEAFLDFLLLYLSNISRCISTEYCVIAWCYQNFIWQPQMWIYDCQINNNFFDPKKQLLQIRKEGIFHQWMMCKTEFDPTVTATAEFATFKR